MPKKLNAKDVRGTTIHPYSRKATQLQRAALRVDKLVRQRRERIEGNTTVLKLAWLKTNLPDGDETMDEAAAHELIERYLERHRPEMEEMEAQLRPNRPKPARLEWLRVLLDRERQEYDTGVLEMPDLAQAKNVRFVRDFEGDANSLDQLTTRFYRRPAAAGGESASGSSAMA